MPETSATLAARQSDCRRQVNGQLKDAIGNGTLDVAFAYRSNGTALDGATVAVADSLALVTNSSTDVVVLLPRGLKTGRGDAVAATWIFR